ncbi:MULTISPECIES: pseudouridine synthase [unclassified Enterococcus]|uniref:pseudouridine synthase n=1 Tax=unclassified Enterococcus TaxID=2608891 RepID=UPI001552F27B|nr:MULTISPECIES: pseudouridine synthase [unclassified Enterococcus]MBS7577349.1 pseudouridine synthase [Enterococcus sp. MMGLQ5-2]MBS7584756.1 pseudouridine synthase [Enterococcus sp. MMGLQ5-1]NPD12611.1 pseudouridine synthase [Enterococcus sp. MMGLQ5-1]NPD37183.1 pseudouridine synthase [Enterococcus sp. MMGLQ5-2]
MRADQLLLQLNIIKYKKELKALIREKRIQVDGEALMSIGQNLDPNIQEIFFDNQQLTAEIHRYIMLNKPLRILCANRDNQYPVVMDLLKEYLDTTKLYTIGRLDFLTSGLLLITDNGPLGISMFHPKFHVKKSYLVTTREKLELEDIVRFRSGVLIDHNTPTQPARLELLGSHLAKVTISEGKYRQIRKMFLSVGKQVIKLERIQFGPLTLDPSLSAGEFRQLNQLECAQLKPYFKPRAKI